MNGTDVSEDSGDFPADAFLGWSCILSPLCVMLALWKGRIVDAGKLSSAIVCLHSHLIFLLLHMNVCYAHCQLDVHVNSRCMCVFFLLLLK